MAAPVVRFRIGFAEHGVLSRGELVFSRPFEMPAVGRNCSHLRDSGISD